MRKWALALLLLFPLVLNAESTDEIAYWKDIQTLYRQAKYDDVMQRSELFEKAFPSSAYLPQLNNLRGLSQLLTKHPQQAAAYFTRAIEASPNHAFKQHILYNLATAQFDSGQTAIAFENVKSMDLAPLDKQVQGKTLFLRARIEHKLEQHANSTMSMLEASLLLTEPEVQPTLKYQIDLSLKVMQDMEALQKLIEKYTTSSLMPQIQARMNELQNKPAPRVLLPGDANKIGLLLPLSGKFATVGRQNLQAIELAFQPTKKILIIEDAGDTPQKALLALERLAVEQGVIAVIGPVLSKGIDQINAKAQELGIPLVSLAQSPGTLNEYVFPAGLTPKMQSQALAKAAVEKMQLKNLAIIYPRNAFGQTYAMEFWDAAEALGGNIAAIESYAPDEADFRDVLDRLTGRHYLQARWDEVMALARMREEQKITKRTRKTDAFFGVSPITRFEAVFVADDPKVAGQILPTFTYRDVERTKFFGISSWHSPDFLNRTGKIAEDTIFPAAFFSLSHAPHIRKFMAQYQENFETDPSSMEAYAYDAAMLLEQALGHSSSITRGELMDVLKKTLNFSGLTGYLTYKDGQLQRNLTLLTVRNGAFTELFR